MVPNIAVRACMGLHAGTAGGPRLRVLVHGDLVVRAHAVLHGGAGAQALPAHQQVHMRRVLGQV